MKKKKKKKIFIAVKIRLLKAIVKGGMYAFCDKYRFLFSSFPIVNRSLNLIVNTKVLPVALTP